MTVSRAIFRVFLGCLFLSLEACVPFKPRRGANDAFIVYKATPKEPGKIRLAVKDIIDVKGYVTTAGSEYVAKTSKPATEDAACMKIARERGAVIVGKTNLTELAVTTSGMNAYFGTPRNRFFDRKRFVPGGSSSGAAVAVKRDMADVSFGTDTAGSIRVPAACCGVYGLKTTFGLVPTKGVFPISPLVLDTVGPLAKDVPRLVEGMGLLERGFAGKYAAAKAAKPTARSIRIGRLYLSGTDKDIDQAIDDALITKGFKVVKLNDAFKKAWDQAMDDGRSVATGDAWLHDQQYSDKSEVNSLTKAVFFLGELEYKNNYRDAMSHRRTWQATLQHMLSQVDFIALPTMQALPPRLPFWGASFIFEKNLFDQQNTVAVNFAGNPAIAIPIPMKGKKEPVPVTSLQLVGKMRGEAELLNAARLLETNQP